MKSHVTAQVSAIHQHVQGALHKTQNQSQSGTTSGSGILYLKVDWHLSNWFPF